jgi:hypothetical protein
LLQLRLSSRVTGPASIRVFDATGRCVMARALSVKRGASNVALDLRSLSAGVYLFRLEEGRTSVVEKVVITR